MRLVDELLDLLENILSRPVIEQVSNDFFIFVVEATLWAVKEHLHQIILYHKRDFMQFRHRPDLHLFLYDVLGAGHALLVTVEAVAQASENVALVVRCLYHLQINRYGLIK